MFISFFFIIILFSLLFFACFTINTVCEVIIFSLIFLIPFFIFPFFNFTISIFIISFLISVISTSLHAFIFFYLSNLDLFPLTLRRQHYAEIEISFWSNFSRVSLMVLWKNFVNLLGYLFLLINFHLGFQLTRFLIYRFCLVFYPSIAIVLLKVVLWKFEQD